MINQTRTLAFIRRAMPWLAICGVAVFSCLGLEMARAETPDFQGLTRSIAGILGYPADRLTFSAPDLSARDKERGGLAHGFIESRDGTFAKVAIGIATRGVILTPKLEAQLEAALKRPPVEGLYLAKVTFSGDACGYTGLGVFGPGGSGERIVVTWPSRGIDLQVSVTVPGEGLTTDESVKAYQILINEGRDPLMKALTQVMREFVLCVEKSDFRAPVGTSKR
jgi:hypothetical protein